jgi:ABC-type phosphate/phosphonate transport system ATPase subunit
MLDKQLEYYMEKEKNNNKHQVNMVKNQANMVKAFTKLTEVMYMVFAQASNIQVPNPTPKNEHEE